MRGIRLAIVAAVCLGLPACSVIGSADATKTPDPFESFNREMFRINRTLDKRAAIPAATFYKSSVPQVVRDGIHNFVSNLAQPVTFANDLLQGEFHRAGEAAERFGVNTTVGILGLRDAATDYGIPYHHEDFGQTLAVYGVPGGPYLVVPLAGPALPRDLGARYVDHFFNPLGYFFHQGLIPSLAEQGVELLDVRSRNINTLRSIEQSSVDMYASVRSLYLQNRENAIRNGRDDVKDLPDF